MAEHRLRTFIAVSLPDAVRRALEGIQSQWKSYRFPVRWVRPESIHLTLKFLGEIPSASVASAVRAMKRAGAEQTPFRLHTEGVGVFPSVRNVRVLWAGVGGEPERLLALQVSLEQALAEEGFARDRRRFKGHLTLGRAKGKLEPSTLTEALSQWRSFRSEPFTVSEMILYSSRLLPTGAVYRPLERVGLGSRKPSDTAPIPDDTG
jgi:2'-5' RNA ligase